MKKLLIPALIFVALMLNLLADPSDSPVQNSVTYTGEFCHFQNTDYLALQDSTIILRTLPDGQLAKSGLKPQKNVTVEGYRISRDMIVTAYTVDGKRVELAGLAPEAFKPASDTRFIVKSDACIGCGLCVSNCPTKAITMVKGKAVIDDKKCTRCGMCKNGDQKYFYGCPTSAIHN
jgi:ferredoxin